MRLDHKRSTIEVLMCAACDVNNVSLVESCGGVPGPLLQAASSAVDETYIARPVGSLRVSERYILAAYRLIESSPTLIREWFGSGARR